MREVVRVKLQPETWNLERLVDVTADVLRRLQPAPYMDHLGCELVAATPGSATVRFDVRPEHGRSSAPPSELAAHGGTLASLVDITASAALITVLAEDEGRTTVDLSIHYLAPARGTLTAVGSVRRRGGRTAVLDVEVSDADGVLVAIGRCTFMIIRHDP